jgi:hypothetical protein
MRRPPQILPESTPNAPFVGLAAAENLGDNRFEAKTPFISFWLQCS